VKLFANFFPCLPDDELDRAIGKLERFVHSLERAGTLPRVAASYRQSLAIAIGEREKRRLDRPRER
jgi:hypothetical protein